jgi:probable phosphoglycerate mutase
VTTFLLVRHATHALLGRVLVGRMSGVPLDDGGREDAGRLADRLAGEGVTELQSSPRERTRQTAEIIGRRLNLPVQTISAIDEIDVGDWTGETFAALQDNPDWMLWNTRRSAARPPGGETMRELQARVIGHLRATAAEQPGDCIALVTHAEAIRAAILHCRGLPLDEFARIEVAPASITAVTVENGDCKLVTRARTLAA